jgi:4-carboxymuconolactone decarboxylase
VKGNIMAEQSTIGRETYGDVAAAFADKVLFNDVWQRLGLSPRDRSIVTVSALVSAYRHNELPHHLKRALDNGVTREELTELVTHLAFYAGWPAASTAIGILRQVLAANPG